jgi:GAF domain-containing protein/anti-sigma regulatory factor (Ser/Thr protein kinase)
VTELQIQEAQASPTPPRSDHTETVATLVALILVAVVAIVDEIYGGKFGLIGFLAIGPFIVAAFAGPRRTAMVGLLAIFFSVVLTSPPRQYGQLNHLLRVATEVASASVAMWISHLRTQRSLQLWRARSDTRNERRRRVAAETAQRMQVMARALTTAADPAQVADAVFAALRDELRVDAATFATTTERGVLQTHRRFGYAAHNAPDRLLAAMEPDGAIGDVLRRSVALFAETIDDLAKEWPGIVASVEALPFNSLAAVPLVVSDRAVGVVVVQWLKAREISSADKNFLFAITGAAAQAVERARLTLMEFDSLQRSQHLHDLSSELAAATTPIDVARAALSSGRRALGAQSAVCRVPAPGERALSCLASSGHPALLSRGDVRVDGTLSGSCFTRGRMAITTLGVGERLADEVAPEVVARAVAEVAAPVTIVTEPLMGSVGPLGVLSFVFVAQVTPSEVELRFLSTLAGLTAQALERAQLFEHEREALRDAETGRERLSLLSEVTRLLSSSLDPTTVMMRTMRLVEGRLADSCLVQVPGESGLERLDVRSDAVDGSADIAVTADEIIPFDSDEPAAIAFRTGRPHLAPTSVFDASEDVGSSALAVPLTVNAEVIGVMTFIDGPGRHFGPDDVSLAVEVAGRTGVALSNATRFQREHVVAEVLQRAVLPDSLPDVGGLLLDAEYRAGAAGTYVGGDWYDVFSLDDQHVVFSVGDVMGKGAAAAALMGQSRSAIRAYAVARQSPSEVLSSIDVLFDALDEERVVTAVIGTINRMTGVVRLANAGHPPPLIVRADGTTAYTTAQGSLLIAAGLGFSQRPVEEFLLNPGDSLIMYSDGLVERRGELLSTGMERLSTLTTAIAREGWPARPAAALASGLSDDEQTDDVVVLSLHYAGVPAEDTEVPSLGTARDGMWTLRLEPVVQSTPMARHWISAHLRGIPNDAAECAALLTSELVTNAVLHAATPISVTLHLMTDRIRVDVADGSPIVPSIKDYGTDAATGRGLTLFSTLASAWGVQPVAGGKIVWFELPVDFPIAPAGVSDGAFRFDLVGMAHTNLHPQIDDDPTVAVHLIGVPVALLQRASEEYEGLFRELRLMKEHAEASPALHTALPERLSVFVAEIGSRFQGFGPGMDEKWQDLVDRQVESYDWDIELPQSAVGACEFYDTMLDEADEFGLSARLLSLPASASSVAVRRWFLSELIGQLRGRAPVPWNTSRFHHSAKATA